MAQQVVGIGTVVNDDTGDPLRTAFDKYNDNFTELYALQSETINAGAVDFVGAGSDENRISAAVAAALVAGATRVRIPASMLPFDASLVSFDYSIQMVREDGDDSGYDVRAYGAAGDNVQNDTISIQVAIASAAAQTDGGVVKLPPGQYKVTDTLDLSFGVQIFGEGQTISVLRPVACHCIGLDVGLYGTGFGNLLLQNFGIDGSSCTTHVAINNAGTLNDADQFYGLTLNKVAITNYNKAVNLRSIRTVLITGCWFQWITTGVDMRGFNLVIRFSETQIICAGGTGSGTFAGVIMDRFDFTAGAGPRGPEGIQFTDIQVFGFETGITLGACNFCNILHCDIDATIYGIEFSTAQNGFTIRDTYVAVTSTGGIAGIIGHGVASPYQSCAVIDTCRVIGSGTTSCVGIQINEAGNSNQDFVRIQNCLLMGLTSSDILINNGKSVTVRGNRCLSTGITNNIVFAGSAGPGPIVVDENECAVGITNPGSFGASGAIDVGVNTIAGVRVGAKDTATAVPYTAGDFSASGSMTWGVDPADILTFIYVRNNRKLRVAWFIVSSTVAGTPSTTLRILIPGGFIPSYRELNPCIITDGGLGSVSAYAQVQAGNALITIDRLDGANLQASTNATNTFGSIEFVID